MTPMNLLQEESQTYSRIFLLQIRFLLVQVLGVPLHYEKLRSKDIQPIVDKTINIISGWQGRLMSYGARLALLKACVSSIPIYLMSVIKLTKWAIEDIN
jgi:hypothetical protein